MLLASEKRAEMAKATGAMPQAMEKHGRLLQRQSGLVLDPRLGGEREDHRGPLGVSEEKAATDCGFDLCHLLSVMACCWSVCFVLFFSCLLLF